MIGGFYIAAGHAESVDARTVRVGDKQLTGEAILIAAGSHPVVPAIEGLNEVPYLTSDLPKKLSAWRCKTYGLTL